MYTQWLDPAKTRIQLADGHDYELAGAVAIQLTEPWVEIRYGATFAPTRTVFLSPSEWRRIVLDR